LILPQIAAAELAGHAASMQISDNKLVIQSRLKPLPRGYRGSGFSPD